MWEELKEVGFTTCAIALACSNLVTFFLIMALGFAPVVYEPWHWVLYLETGLDAGFIVWGIERLVGDIKRNGM